jgi:nitroreductase
MPEETHDLFEIMATTRSMRRLKPDPVSPELIRKILNAGVSAPSGGNMQRWRFIVVRDAKIKQMVGAYYRRAWDEVVAPRLIGNRLIYHPEISCNEARNGTTQERCSRSMRSSGDHVRAGGGGRWIRTLGPRETDNAFREIVRARSETMIREVRFAIDSPPEGEGFAADIR